MKNNKIIYETFLLIILLDFKCLKYLYKIT